MQRIVQFNNNLLAFTALLAISSLVGMVVSLSNARDLGRAASVLVTLLINGAITAVVAIGVTAGLLSTIETLEARYERLKLLLTWLPLFLSPVAVMETTSSLLLWHTGNLPTNVFILMLLTMAPPILITMALLSLWAQEKFDTLLHGGDLEPLGDTRYEDGEPW